MSWIVMELLVGWAGAALGAGPSCSTESWPRRQEVISRRAATAVIYHQYQWLTAAYLSGIDWRTVQGGPKRCGQSMGAFHSPWTSAFWSSPLIGWVAPILWGFFLFSPFLCIMKRSGRRVMNTLVLAACWASRGCAWHMCENPVVFPPTLPRTHRSRLEVWFKFAL